MHLVENETRLRKDGVIQIPDKELEATGLQEGDEARTIAVQVSEQLFTRLKNAVA